MSTLKTVTVTIGRNIPTRHIDAAYGDGLISLRDPELTPSAWENFTDFVREALNDYGDTIEANSWWVEEHSGTAQWEGVAEESRKLTLLWDETQVIPARLQSARETLIQELLSARTGFYQDAVALSFGESVLV